jgi:3-phenylpropionate/trans-cinnamate dioxygenase ferredoxin component
VSWVAVAQASDIDVEDVVEVSLEDRVLAVYHAKDGFYCSDGICTHEHARLGDGVVLGNIIECPKHQGRFDVRTGDPKGPPVHVPLHTYPTRVESGTIYVDIEPSR